MGTEVNHVHLQIHGKYKASELAGEEWAITFNFIPRTGNTLEDIYTVANDFTAAYTPKTTAGTGYTGEANYILDGGGVENDLDPLDWLEDQVMPAAIAYIATTSMFPTTVYVDEITAWPVDNAGKVCQLEVGAAYARITATVDTWDGSSASAPGAPFTTLSITKETLANIPRGRGRFFPPMQIQSSDTSGLVGSATRTASTNAAKALLEGMQWAAGGTGPSIWPVVIGSPWTTAYLVKGVSMDNLPDTQRRRKKSLTPVRTEVSLSY